MKRNRTNGWWSEPGHSTRYNPWRHLRDCWPEVTVVHEELPPRVLGLVKGDGLVISINQRITRFQARCVLAHEIVHLERGIFDCRGQWRAKEEKVVHELASRRLITLEQFAGAIVACGDEDERLLAVELEVDRATLHVRSQLLTEMERRTVAKFLAERAVWLVG